MLQAVTVRKQTHSITRQ